MAGSQTGVNRAAKADRVTRGGGAVGTDADDFDPARQSCRYLGPDPHPRGPESRNVPPAPVLSKPGDRKLTVACEPMVSTLTEVAKLLQPGRCVT